MRTGAFCYGVLFCLFASQVLAQATVKAGEHAEFSRLVVYLPKSQQWSFTETSAGYQLVVNNWEDGFDTSTVFDWIPKTRIFALTQNKGQLDIQLACDCTATAEALELGGVIVDVGAARQGDERVPPLAAQERSPVVLPQRNGAGDVVIETLGRVSSEPKPHPDLEPFRLKLLQNIGRSASLSFVILNPDLSSDNANGKKNSAKRQVLPDDLARFKASGRVRITTALDAALSDGRLEPKKRASDINICPDPKQFTVENWGGDTEFADQLGSLRHALLGEFDAPNRMAARDLARFYAFYGLGAEARAVLAQFELSKLDETPIIMMAQVIEPQSDLTPDNLANLIHCPPAIAIWAAMVSPEVASLPIEKVQQIVSQFAQWPPHLRHLLGPKLVEKLVSGGHDEPAGVVGSIITRPSGETPPELKLVSARQSDAALLTGGSFVEMIERNDSRSPEALDLFLNARMDEGQQISDDYLDLAAAYSRELDGLPISNALRNTFLLGLAYSGSFEVAISETENAISDQFEFDNALFDQMVFHFLQLAETQPVATFGMQLIQNGFLPDVSEERASELVTRLLNDGLPEIALEVLVGSELRSTPSILAADVYDALEKSPEAEELLLQIDGPESDIRRAEQMLISGRAESAWREFSADAPQQLSERLAWAAAQWQGVESDDAKGQVAALITKTPETELESAPLTTAKTLLSQSQDTRTAVAALFEQSAQ